MSESQSFWRRWLGKAANAPAGESVAAEIPPGLQRYELGDEIGRGAMAIVFGAVDRASGEQVAIKRLALQREFAAEDLKEVRQRFMREARAAGHLKHPDILRVIDAGEADADAWIAMERVRGVDLSHFTRPGQLLPLTETLQLGIRLARALAYAHSQGVIHRDIKPANVMFERASGAVKVMDFGIARIADGSRTRTGLVLGTPSFMSPEQLAGLKVDGRSDLYSLGALLYQLLTGNLPHQSESMAKLMYQIANQAPPDVRHYRPELPEALALVLALTLEKRPELRYASGEQLALDLEAVLPQCAQAPAAAPLSQGVPPHASADSVDPFAQTVRIDTRVPGQNSKP
ncbi:MAG TPA: serine/threonine-protein kinase [Burkholderiaceae bacterium]